MYKKSVTYTPRTKTPEQALVSLMRTCARAERCSSDALRSMRRWGLSESDAQGVLERLVRERFIDDGRYASAYVREKMRFSGWGERKIAMQLRLKGVERETISAVLSELMADDDTAERLRERLEKRLRTTKAANDYELKGKLFRYALGLGYDYDVITSVIDEVIERK